METRDGKFLFIPIPGMTSMSIEKYQVLIPGIEILASIGPWASLKYGLVRYEVAVLEYVD